MIAALLGLISLDWWLEVRNGPPAPSALTGLPLTALVCVLVVIGFREVARLAAGAGLRLLAVTGVIGSAATACLPYWWRLVGDAAGEYVYFPGLLALAFVLAAVLGEQMLRYRVEDALRRTAATAFAVLYLGIGGAMLLRIRFVGGVPALLLFLAVVKFTDIGAYFTGTAIGRHKMIPWLSPGKSWAGLVGGLATAVSVSVLTVHLLNVPGLSAGEAAVFGLVVGLAGQFGDLCESLLKRSAQVKDSGALVPEFGGLLDLVDSPLMAAPFGLVLLALMT